MSGISTHVLDNARGRPGAGVGVTLEFRTATGWEVKGSDTTGDDGRIDSLLSKNAKLKRGIYRLNFDASSYFHLLGQESFYPQVVVVFEVAHADEHYHIPLLLNAFGYTTYRGG